MNYTVDDYGLILGLLTVPPGEDEDKFYENDIEENLVRKYKNARKDNSFSGKDPLEAIYNPIGFKTFGDNDLMFYTLFDDFAYPNRVFHPFNGNGENAARYCNFDYQLVVGLNAFGSDNKSADSLLAATFGSGELNRYIFTCATRFKINPIFLCGTGLHCVELIKAALRELHGQFDGHIILLNGVGSDELIMLNFSNDICSMAKFIYQARNLQFGNLKTERTAGLYEQVHSNCILNSASGVETEKAHIFSSSYSLSGYALDSRASLLPEAPGSDDFSLQFTWDIKPGHIGSFTKKLTATLRRLSLEPQKDKLFINRTLVNLTISGKDIHTTESLLSIINKLRSLDIEKCDIRKLRVVVSVTDSDRYLIENENGLFPHVEPFDHTKHPSTRKFFQKYLFTPEAMGKLREYLDRGRISKVLKERIMKMYQNYNDCVQDPQFVVSFIGLKAFLDRLLKVVEIYAEGKSDNTSNSFHEWLDSSVRDFEQAYLNRFHQSNRMRTMSDFNLEWNGGIQQLICSMNFAYKTLMECCGVKEPDSFIYVSGHERVHVNDHAYRINMQQITYPELFASTLWKEFFNFMPQKFGISDDKEIFPFSKIISDRFVGALKERIGTHLKFNRANPTHRVFLQKLDKEFLTSIMADLMTFYYGYNASLEDFTFWYMRYLLQTPCTYNRNGTVSHDNFTIFFCRVVLTHIFSGASQKDIEKLRFNAPDPSIAGLWTESFSDVLTLASLLSDILAPHRFVEIIKGIVTHILVKQFRLSPPKDLPPKIVLEMVCKMRKDSIEKAIGYFSDDIIKTEITDVELISGLLPGFLKYLHGIITAGGCPCIALTRDEDGHPDIKPETARYFSPLLADPLGGSFSIDSDMHIRYFKARSVLYLSLFHFYQVNVHTLTKKPA